MKPNAAHVIVCECWQARLLSRSVLCNGLDVYSSTSCRNSSNHVLDRVLYQRAQDEEHWTDGPIKQPEAGSDTIAVRFKNDPCRDCAAWGSQAHRLPVGGDAFADLGFGVSHQEGSEHGD